MFSPYHRTQVSKNNVAYFRNAHGFEVMSRNGNQGNELSIFMSKHGAWEMEWSVGLSFDLLVGW